MKNLLILLSIIFIVPNLFSQGISINNSNTAAHESAMLDVSSTTKGVLIPRMTKSQRDAIISPALGLMIFQSDQSPGFYYCDGTSWHKVGPADFANGGDAAGADRSLGNTDNYDLSLLTNNTQRFKINNDGGVRFDGKIGIFTDPEAPGINNSIKLYDATIYSNPHLIISGHNSAYIDLISRRTGVTSGKTWRISSGSGSVLDLDRFFISNPDDGHVLTIRKGGNIGIGVDSALTKLQVGGNITFAPAGLTTDESRFIGQSIFSQSTFEASNGFGGMEVENIDKAGTDDSAQELHFWTHNQGTDSRRRVTIDTNGYVGIGTEDPFSVLEVVRDGAVSNIVSTTYRSSGFSGGGFVGRGARGNKDAPSALNEGDFMASFNARGYGTTGFSSLPRGRLAFKAAQNWTDTEQGSHLVLETVPLNGTSDEERLKITSQGNVGIGTVGLPNPEHKLHIVQDSTGGQALMVTQNADQNAATIDIPNTSSTAHALNIYNSGSGYGLDLVIQPTGTGHGGRFTIDNPNNDQPSIYGEHNGTGHVAEFLVLNSDHSSPALYVQHNGKGNVGQFLSNNNANTNAALFVSTQGTGPGGDFQVNNILSNSPAVNANTIGTGSAGVFTISNGTNAFSSVYSNTSGIGNAGRFQISNSSSDAVALFAKSNGTGPALGGNSNGDGIAGFFNVLNNTNAKNALEVKTLGLGSAALFKVDNALSTDTVVVIEGNGNGPSLVADGTIDVAGFKMPTSPALGHVLTSDASGEGTWQAPAFDFSNGGENGGTDRTLGNQDNFDLGLITNNLNRLHIQNDGKIGIGTTDPSDLLEVKGGSDGEFFGISINQKTDHLGYPSLFFKDNSENLLASIFPHQTRTHLYFRLTSGDFIFDRPGGGTPQFTIKSSGNVGIGTTSPGSTLEVAGDSRIEGDLSVGHTGVDKQIFFNGTVGDGVIKMYSSGELGIGTDDGVDLRLAAGETFKIQTFAGSLQDRFFIANDGKVGMGTTAPQSTLQVNGGIQLSDDTDAASADKVGTLRYRTETGTPNKSFVEMCMQTGTTTYEWVIIKENSW